MAKFILGSKFTLSRSLKSHLAETCLTLEDVTIHVTCIFQVRIQDFVKVGGGELLRPKFTEIANSLREENLLNCKATPLTY